MNRHCGERRQAQDKENDGTNKTTKRQYRKRVKELEEEVEVLNKKMRAMEEEGIVLRRRVREMEGTSQGEYKFYRRMSAIGRRGDRNGSPSLVLILHTQLSSLLTGTSKGRLANKSSHSSVSIYTGSTTSYVQARLCYVALGKILVWEQDL